MRSLPKCFRSSGRAYTSGGLILAVALLSLPPLPTCEVLFAAAIAAFGTDAILWPFYMSLFLSHHCHSGSLLSAVCHRVLVKPVLIVF